MTKVPELLEKLEIQASKFEGDKRLFWAGRMYEASRKCLWSTSLQLSENLDILDAVSNRYDLEIRKQSNKE